jgi:hypothetical protein
MQVQVHDVIVAPIRADAREGVHLHLALRVTDSHRAVRQ